MSQPKNLKVIIAGGGTGGHVFPAIAIANAIRSKAYNAMILFVGAKGRLEMKKVPAAGYHIVGLNIAGLQRRLTWKNLLVPFKLFDSLIRSKNIIKRFRPDVVIGVGGYASGPILRAAAKQGVPTLIQEQNSYAGLTNKLLAKKVDKICVAYEGMEKFFPKDKIYLTGNPVRNDILKAPGKKQEALAYFNLSINKKVVLMVGGSLGALSMNEAMKSSLKLLVFNDVQLIWQTGKNYYQTAWEAVTGMEKFGIVVSAFIDRMDLAYAACDLVVSRAGAIAVSEICALQLPSVLVPSPNVAEDHQTKNAMALVNLNAAVLVTDKDAQKELGPAIIDLIFDEDKIFKLKENIARMSYRDAANNIASMAMSLVKN
ncbi:MAG: undecaprenyldiphospho-muramoylpentapeptide beta-N-acetylglucosaminyltransferase [Bacteroidetes bacterium]|nr:MAG: undecaprenyldiphospho-muramoylpentapeptide beta-N-acetylglucosaminyltransferase [Bacteroidota bacterium]